MTWIQVIGAITCVIGIIIIGIQFGFGDENAPSRLKKALLGAIVVVCAPALMKLMEGFFAK
jgi:type IV secretory pathway VirB2 component (pilin)